MAFVVETGTGLATATAYVDVAYVDTYFADRANAAWAGTTAAKQAAIIKATDYIDTRWGNFFLGRSEFPDTPQALCFPRLNILNKDGRFVTGIPTNLKKATAEYALRALTITLLPDPTIDDSGRAIASKSEKVGPIEQSTDYQVDEAAPIILRPYPAADRLLFDYISPSGRNFR